MFLPTRRLAMAFALLLAAIPQLLTATGDATHVLILHSYGRDFAPWCDLTAAFRDELARDYRAPVEFHEVVVDTACTDGPSTEAVLARYLCAAHAGHPPDLAVAVGAPAARFWQERCAKTFPATVLLIGGIERRVLDLLPRTSNAVTVAMDLDVCRSLEDVLRLLPETTHMAFVAGSSPVERFWADQCRAASAMLTNRVAFIWLDALPMDDLVRRVAALPRHTALLCAMLMVDADGVPRERLHSLERLRAVAQIPLFGLFEKQLGHGIVGGRLFSEATVGREMGHVAARVLQCQPAATIPSVVVAAGRPAYDWRELRRHAVDERRLPADSDVRFRDPTVWQRYHRYVLAAAVIILIQALTIVGLLAQRTRRRRMEVSLREHRQFMELATSAGGLGLWVLDIATGILRPDARLRALAGLPPDGPVRLEDLVARIHPADRTRTEAVLRRAVSEGRGFDIEGRFLLPDGTERWILVKGMAVTDGHGRPLRAQGVVQDLTSRHEAEQAAQRHRNDLIHIGRVNVLGQLSSALAHELNQPLGAIMSNAEAAELFLTNNPPPLDELRAILADIRKDDRRAADVIRHMRDFLRRHEMEPVSLSPGDLVTESIALSHPDAIERQVVVEGQVPASIPKVRADRVHIQQVLLNLLLNGMDAMRDRPTESRRLTVRAECGNDHSVEFAVIDRGEGIPPERLGRVFEPFYTTKPSGLGIGLSISRTIIEAHHGRIWAEPTPGGGATFRFTLPLAED